MTEESKTIIVDQTEYVINKLNHLILSKNFVDDVMKIQVEFYELENCDDLYFPEYFRNNCEAKYSLVELNNIDNVCKAISEYLETLDEVSDTECNDTECNA